MYTSVSEPEQLSVSIVRKRGLLLGIWCTPWAVPASQWYLNKVTYIIEDCGYWRKANGIHAWFVQNVQEGEDDCKEYYVSQSKLEKYKKTREAQKQYYYSRTNYQKTEKELRTIIDESNKLRDTIKEQLKEAQKSREDENELEKIRSQIENLQKLVEKARTKIRPFHKPHFSTKKNAPKTSNEVKACVNNM